MRPGLVKPGSRRRQHPAAPLAEVAHLAGVLQAYLDTFRQDSYTRPCLVEDCVTVSRDTPEEAKYSASFVFPTCCPPPQQVPGRGEAIGK